MTRVPSANSRLLLAGIGWRTYTRLLYVFAERPGIRLTYDRGGLEIRAPSTNISRSGFFGCLVGVLTEELNLPVKAGGSTTCGAVATGAASRPTPVSGSPTLTRWPAAVGSTCAATPRRTSPSK